jgi:hypothetical protein
MEIEKWGNRVKWMIEKKRGVIAGINCGRW